MAQLVRTLETVRTRVNPALEIEGIVFTLFDGRTSLTTQVRTEVERYFKGRCSRRSFRAMSGCRKRPATGGPFSSTTSGPRGRWRTWSWRRRSWGVMKRALGRGLGALLPPTETEDAARLRDLPVESLVPNPQQPRKSFDPRALEELATSIRASGVLQPLVVRPRGSQFEILVGERRWRAAQQAGLIRVPAIVREASDAEALELGLVENLLREDLNPVEAAQAYQRLLAEFGWTQEELAQRLGKDRSSIANALRLLRLPEPIQEDLRTGRLTMGHARALLGLPSAAAQLRLRERILSQDWWCRDRGRRPGPPARAAEGPPAPAGCGGGRGGAPAGLGNACPDRR